MNDKVELRRELNGFDVTNLVVGSSIGADIYIAAALGAKMVGPISLLVWLLAGIIACMRSFLNSQSLELRIQFQKSVLSSHLFRSFCRIGVLSRQSAMTP